MSSGLSELHITGLRLAGYVSEAERIALDRHEERSGAPSRQFVTVVLLGHAALARGQLQTCIRRLREARAGLAPLDSGGWGFRCLISLAQALAMAGDAAAARQTLPELEAERHPGYAYSEPEVLLAQAWVAAAEGTESHRHRTMADRLVQHGAGGHDTGRYGVPWPPLSARLPRPARCRHRAPRPARFATR